MSGDAWRLSPTYFSRWSSLSGAVVVNIFSGLSYSFGIYSRSLKESLGFSQGSVDLIASLGEAGQWSTFLVGLLLERYSPRQVYAMGSLAIGIGLGYVSLAIGKILPTNPACMGVSLYVANFGSACFAQTATSTVLRNFPATETGKVSGMIKSIFGLSSAVLSVMYTGLFGDSGVGGFLLLLSIGVPVLGVLSSIPMNIVPAKHLSYATERVQGVTARLSPFYMWFAAVTMFLVATIVPIPAALPAPWMGILLVALVLSVAALPLLYGPVRIVSATLGMARDICVSGGSSETLIGGNDREGIASDFRAEEDACGHEYSPLLGSSEGFGSTAAGGGSSSLRWRQCVQDVRFWVLFLGFLCGAGSGLVVINNVASLADSLEVTSSGILVSVIGICNAMGRLGVGWVSDRVVAAGLPRSLLFCAALLVSCGVDFMLAAGIRALLYPLCVAAGLCYGSIFALVLALTADLFGSEHVGTNYGLLDLGPAIGSFVYATGVVSLFYKSDSTDTPGGYSGDCFGPQCFSGTFLCTAISCLGACFAVYIFLVKPDVKGRLHRAAL